MIRRVTKLKVLSRLICYQFYLPKAKEVKYTDQFKTDTNDDGTLQPVADSFLIKDFDDKFGLEEIRDHLTIINHLNQAKQNYELNDLIYFFRHLTQLCDDQIIVRSELVQNSDFKELLKHVKERLKSNNHEKYPFIGSYAYCFNQLKINDKELWEVLEQKVLDDEYYTNFKESVYAVQGFTRLPQVLFGKTDEQIQIRINALYKKIERIVCLTIWEVSPTYYQKIATSLAKVNRFDTYTFAKLEQHILTNLSLDYETRIMVDILLAFSKGKQGSPEFYDSMQYVIFKGHMFNRNYFLQSKIEIQFDGHVVSGLMEIFDQVRGKYETFTLHPNFKSLVHKYIQKVNRKTIYDYTSATRTLIFLKTFEFEDTDEIRQHIYQNLIQYKGNISIQEMLNFYTYIDHEQQGNELSFQIFQKLEQYFLDNSNRFSIEEITRLYNYLYFKPEMISQNIRLQEKLLQIIQTRLNEMESSQIQDFQLLFENIIEKTLFLEEQSSLIIKTNNQTVNKEFFQMYKQTVSKLNDIRIIQKFSKQIGSENKLLIN